MSDFPTEHSDLRAAYFHLKDFGQETHADTVKRFATQFKEVHGLLRTLRLRVLELEAERPRASYEENRQRELEKRARNRPAAND